MNVFVSYASEHRTIADRIAVGLRTFGHEVFFDRDNLPPGEAYHAEIQRSIRGTDLFVFLVSRASLEKSSYALTELGLARERWPDPSGRILPVMVEPVPIADIPAYLTSVTLLETQGDLVAETIGRAASILDSRRRRRLVLTAACVVGATALGVIGFMSLRPGPTPSPPPEPCRLAGRLEARESGRTIPKNTLLEVTYAGSSQSFSVLADGALPALEVGPLTAPSDVWTISVISAQGIVGPRQVTGCPASADVLPMGSGYELSLRPR